MISVYFKQSRDSAVEKLQDLKTGSWVHVEQPDTAEIATLVEDLGLDEGLISDALDINEVPRLEVKKGLLYLFCRYVLMGEDPIDTAPLLIVMAKKHIITITLKNYPDIEEFLSGKIHFSTQNKNMLLIKLLKQINGKFDIFLNTFTKRLRRTTGLIENITNKDIVQFVDLENVLYDVNTSLVRMGAMYKTLEIGRVMQFENGQKQLVEDLTLESEQLILLTKENIRTLVNIREAYSTIMTNNLNRVIKLFTSVTVILTIPTIIGTFYGMNVKLPLQDHPLTFILLVTGTLVASYLILRIFRKNDWL